MFKRKSGKKLGISLMILACTMTMTFQMYATEITIPSEITSSSGVGITRADNIGWQYKTISGQLYKRLFNHTRNEWIGDWIPY